MFETSIRTIEELKIILLKLPKEIYTSPGKTISNATIGQHTRHIIEIYLSLLNGYDHGEVSYDKRRRSKKIEKNITIAIEKLQFIQENIEKPNKQITMCHKLNGQNHYLSSNYFREVIYNLEHAIHHHAIIRFALNAITNLEIPESFGIAPSTLEYRKKNEP
jgi:hypothetical protein